MSAIGKGDWVQCVDERQPPCGVFGFRVGDVACVLAASISPRGNPCVALVDDPNPAFWSVNRFRPLGGNAKTITAPPIRQTQDA